MIAGNGNDGVNEGDGVAIVHGSGNKVLGNLIGINVGVNGVTPLGNTRYGVCIMDSPENTIGGDTALPGIPGPPPGNIISENGEDGVFIEGSASSGNRVLGNLIGVDVLGTVDGERPSWGWHQGCAQ